MVEKALPAAAFRKFLRPGPELSQAERAVASFLIIDEDSTRSELLRKALASLRFQHFSILRTGESALAQLAERSFSHIIFSIASTEPLSPEDFIAQALRVEAEGFMIVLSSDADGEQIFNFLRAGAHGFLLEPFSAAELESLIVEVTKGEPISRKILEASDRNAVFAALVAGNLDKVVDAHRLSAGNFEEESEKLRRSAKSARLFSQGGEDALLSSFVSFFSQLANGPATSLGRLRERLKRKRQEDKFRK